MGPMTARPEQARRRPTIDDVARRAGVSSAAVSFAMNGRRGVGEARARGSSRRRPSSAGARAHRRVRSAAARAGAIGLLLARPVETLEVDPFFLRFLAGVERALASTDHALLLRVLDSDGPVDPEAYARLAAQGRSTASCSPTSSPRTRASSCSPGSGCPPSSRATRPAVPVPRDRDPPRRRPGGGDRAPDRAR